MLLTINRTEPVGQRGDFALNRHCNEFNIISIASLVFRKKDLYLIITQKLIFLKSGGFHVKSTQNLIKSDVSTKTLQFGGCREGAMTQDFMKSWFIAPLLHSSN